MRRRVEVINRRHTVAYRLLAQLIRTMFSFEVPNNFEGAPGIV